MSVSETILKKTSNWFRTIGTVYELGLKREACDIKQKDEDGNDAGTKKGERILGNVSIKTDNGIHTFNVYAQSLTSKGEETKQWKMYCDMLKWNPKLKGDPSIEPTLVNIGGSVSINDYVNQRGEVSSVLRWRVAQANTNADESMAKGTTLKATLFIQSIKPEVRQDKETGRLCVTLYGAEANGTCFPVNAIVDEDMAEDFEACYEVGMTVPFELELNARHVGNSNNAPKKFGRAAKVSVNSGFDVQELVIVNGGNEIEEPDETVIEDENGNEVEVQTEWINPVAMKKAIKVRAQMLEQLKQNPPKTNKQSSVKAAKQAAKNKATFVNSAPFDSDDDDIF